MRQIRSATRSAKHVGSGRRSGAGILDETGKAVSDCAEQVIHHSAPLRPQCGNFGRDRITLKKRFRRNAFPAGRLHTTRGEWEEPSGKNED